MPARGGRTTLVLLAIGLIAGCGGGEPTSTSGGPTVSATNPNRRVHFVGFDASEPLVSALKDSRIEGLVLQDPLTMGKLGVLTLARHLEKQPVEKVIATGETVATPRNMAEPAIAKLLSPPKAENRSDTNLSGSKSKKWRIMVIPKGTSHEFWKTIHAGAIQGAEEAGNVEVIWQGPQKEDDRLQQIQLVQGAVAAGVDGIVLAPLDAKALVPPVEAAVAKGIPVVIIDSSLESDKIVSYVATDNRNGGVLAAQRLGELLKGEGKVIVLRMQVGSASTEAREQGFIDTIKQKFPKITFLSNTELGGPTSDTAQLKAQSLVTRFRGQVDGVFCPNESTTFGMLRALEQAGMLSKAPPAGQP
jgi:ribose transport system substrate-binding protein